MPWKECHVMDERLRFVARLLDGERPGQPIGQVGRAVRLLQEDPLHRAASLGSGSPATCQS